VKAARPNPHHVKRHRTYTVEEVVALFGVHHNTVRNWLKKGLTTIDQGHPALIHGAVLVDYLRHKRTRNKQTCPPGHLFCVRCKAPQVPVGKAAAYLPFSTTQGRLVGPCPDCGHEMSRRSSLATLPPMAEMLRITMLKAEDHMSEIASPIENCDFEQEGENHAHV
jgi:hypothetical protein